MLVGGNGARAHHPRCHHSLRTGPRDGFEGFDKNYARATNFHRPKLKLSAVTDSRFSVLDRTGNDFGVFFENCGVFFENLRFRNVGRG